MTPKQRRTVLKKVNIERQENSNFAVVCRELYIRSFFHRATSTPTKKKSGKYFMVGLLSVHAFKNFVRNQILAKSLHRSCTWRHFYGTENEIWIGFGPVVNTEKKIGGWLWATFEGVFSCFQGQKIFFLFKYCSIRSKRLHNMKVGNPPKYFNIYRTRAIIIALVYMPRILSFKKESRNNGRSAA